jgi:hypothetical protein
MRSTFLEGPQLLKINSEAKAAAKSIFFILLFCSLVNK